MKILTRYLVISITLSVALVYIFHFTFNEDIELDMLSHFFGGVAVVIGIIKMSNHFSWGLGSNHIIYALIFFIVIFELLEYIVFCTVLSEVYIDYPSFFTKPGYWYDLAGDVLSGTLGGVMAIRIIRNHNLIKRAECYGGRLSWY